jgi:hypothetical protein
MDEPQVASPRTHRAGGGREAKRAARLARAATSVPYITRKVGVYEVLDEEGLATIERMPTRSSPRSASTTATTPKRWRSGRRRARKSTALASAARPGCAAAS